MPNFTSWIRIRIPNTYRYQGTVTTGRYAQYLQRYRYGTYGYVRSVPAYRGTVPVPSEVGTYGYIITVPTCTILYTSTYLVCTKGPKAAYIRYRTYQDTYRFKYPYLPRSQYIRTYLLRYLTLPI